MGARQLRGGSGGDMAGPLRRLAGRWEVVPRPVIGGTAEHPAQVDLALLHPGRGIALVDLAPKVTVHAVASLRQVLDAARLDARPAAPSGGGRADPGVLAGAASLAE